LSHGERERLKYQAGVMWTYSDVLGERIRAFPASKTEDLSSLANTSGAPAVGPVIEGMWLEALGGNLVNMNQMSAVRIVRYLDGRSYVAAFHGSVDTVLFTGSEEECAGYINNLKSKLCR